MTQTQPDIVLRHTDGMLFELFSGDRFKSLEELQNHLLHPLARMIADLFRLEFELEQAEQEDGEVCNCGPATILQPAPSSALYINPVER